MVDNGKTFTVRRYSNWASLAFYSDNVTLIKLFHTKLRVMPLNAAQYVDLFTNMAAILNSTILKILWDT